MKKVNFGTSPAFILFVIFLILKLCGVIAWSWLWVTSPLWIPIPLVIIAIIMIKVGKK